MTKFLKKHKNMLLLSILALLIGIYLLKKSNFMENKIQNLKKLLKDYNGDDEDYTEYFKNLLNYINMLEKSIRYNNFLSKILQKINGLLPFYDTNNFIKLPKKYNQIESEETKIDKKIKNLKNKITKLPTFKLFGLDSSIKKLEKERNSLISNVSFAMDVYSGKIDGEGNPIGDGYDESDDSDE